MINLNESTFYLADRTYKKILNTVKVYAVAGCKVLAVFFYLMGFDLDWAGQLVVLVQVHDQLDCFDLMVLIGLFPYLIQFGYLYLKMDFDANRPERNHFQNNVT